MNYLKEFFLLFAAIIINQPLHAANPQNPQKPPFLQIPASSRSQSSRSASTLSSDSSDSPNPQLLPSPAVSPLHVAIIAARAPSKRSFQSPTHAQKFATVARPLAEAMRHADNSKN
ncbi:MAG TPA: hypothetical protein VGT41_06320 [Candidatus Babeliales bacterium]|nr:hypothetical protein [Candidatus Babeliales bacterium]